MQRTLCLGLTLWALGCAGRVDEQPPRPTPAPPPVVRSPLTCEEQGLEPTGPVRSFLEVECSELLVGAQIAGLDAGGRWLSFDIAGEGYREGYVMRLSEDVSASREAELVGPLEPTGASLLDVTANGDPVLLTRHDEGHAIIHPSEEPPWTEALDGIPSELRVLGFSADAGTVVVTLPDPQGQPPWQFTNDFRTYRRGDAGDWVETEFEPVTRWANRYCRIVGEEGPWCLGEQVPLDSAGLVGVWASPLVRRDDTLLLPSPMVGIANPIYEFLVATPELTLLQDTNARGEVWLLLLRDGHAPRRFIMDQQAFDEAVALDAAVAADGSIWIAWLAQESRFSYEVQVIEQGGRPDGHPQTSERTVRTPIETHWELFLERLDPAASAITLRWRYSSATEPPTGFAIPFGVDHEVVPRIEIALGQGGETVFVAAVRDKRLWHVELDGGALATAIARPEQRSGWVDAELDAGLITWPCGMEQYMNGAVEIGSGSHYCPPSE